MCIEKNENNLNPACSSINSPIIQPKTKNGQKIKDTPRDEAIHESEEKYRMLLDGIRDYAIFMMNPLGQIVSWNTGAERIEGYTAEEIIGQNFSRFFHPEEIEQGKPEEILRLTAANGRHEEQAWRVRKDGSRFLANITFTALLDLHGNLRGFSEFSHAFKRQQRIGGKISRFARSRAGRVGGRQSKRIPDWCTSKPWLKPRNIWRLARLT